MRRAILARVALVLACAALSPLAGCDGGGKELGGPVAIRQVGGPDGPPPPDAGSEPLKDEIPAGATEAVMAAHYAGLGLMEQFEYARAAERFEEVRRLAPGWIAGSINLAIARLNQTGVKIAEEQEKGGGRGTLSNFEEALILLDGVLGRDPKNLHAHFCKGIILEQVGEWRAAHEAFKVVVDADPSDCHALYWYGATLPGNDGKELAIDIKDSNLILPVYEKVVACNPYLASAYYRLAMASRRVDPPNVQKYLETKGQLDPNKPEPPPGPGDEVVKAYGLMGKYATVVGPPSQRVPPAASATPPAFEALRPMAITLAEGDRWAGPGDFAGRAEGAFERLRASTGAAIAAFDADRDGRLDLLVAGGVVGEAGPRDALLLSRGEGRFEDATIAAGLPADRASLGVAVGDFDADGHQDLYLTGVGGNRLMRGLGGARFEDLTDATCTRESDAICPTARWLDLDQDGDLDLIVVRHAALADAGRAFGSEPPAGLPLAAYRNDGVPAPTAGPSMTWAPLAVEGPDSNAVAGLSIAIKPWPDAAALAGAPAANRAVAALDLDSDRDLDLVVAADGRPMRVVWNDRLGRFREADAAGSSAESAVTGLLVADFDRDGRSELLATVPGGRSLAFRNAADGRDAVQFEPWPLDARGWRAAVARDVDLDGWIDLVGLPDGGEPAGAWARNEGDRLLTGPLPVVSDGSTGPPLEGVALIDVTGSPLPDLVSFHGGTGPMVAENRGNGNRWLGIDLAGRWNVTPKAMRTNPAGLGTKLALMGEGLNVPLEWTTLEAGPAQSSTPIVLGVGDAPIIPLVHLTWPDGVMQCEMNKAADQVLDLAENNRKTGSCPVLFTWNGQRFVCLGDFLGGGGLGYMVAPGVYGQPDRDEAMAIAGDQLAAVDGAFRVSITEPMDEVAYLDHLMLEVVDRPPGVSAAPDERFAPGGNRPTGELIAWRDAISPAAATDLEGRDVARELAAWDRDTVDAFARRVEWIGYAEEHGIVLDFADRLAAFGPEDRLVLCLAGWVEYPYSQTNYAAATAGVALMPPVLERLREDGTWAVLEADPGYPAGLPRMTTLDLTGKLVGPRCVIRLRTNMECYWDQAFLAIAEPLDSVGLRVTSLPVARAALGDRGYTREVSPDGRLPLLYDYAYVDPAPLAPFRGMLTRHGDVAELLTADDDRLCLVGPGDEVRVEFDAASAPDLPEGWTRSYVLRCVGYCKDADPFTAGSDEVGPLPWKAMPAYPFEPGVERPRDPAYDDYLSRYQTRPAGR